MKKEIATLGTFLTISITLLTLGINLIQQGEYTTGAICIVVGFGLILVGLYLFKEGIIKKIKQFVEPHLSDPKKPKVKKKGKVSILQFKRKEYHPERPLSVERCLRKLRTFFPCRANVITAERLIDLILKTFGDDYEYHILISDEKFRIITKDQMAQLLKEDDTETLPYIPTYGDCDDFSDVLLGSLTRKTWQQGFAIGQLWYYTPTFGHAVNLFCDGEKIWIVEPQNDKIVEWGTGNYCGKAFLVKF